MVRINPVTVEVKTFSSQYLAISTYHKAVQINFADQVGNYFKPARASRLMAQAQETQRAVSKFFFPYLKLARACLLFVSTLQFFSPLHLILFFPPIHTPYQYMHQKSTSFKVIVSICPPARVPCSFLFTELVQTKQSPRNEKSAAIQNLGKS